MKARQLMVFLGFGLMPASLAAQAAGELRCAYTHRESCDETGCKVSTTGSDYLLIPQPKDLFVAYLRVRDGQAPVTVRRCDEKGCTPVEVTSAASGIAYLNVWKIDGGYMLKFAEGPESFGVAKPGTFVEVATTRLGVLISHGVCPWPMS